MNTGKTRRPSSRPVRTGWISCLLSMALALPIAPDVRADTKNRIIVVGTGAPTGDYHKVGSAICDIVNTDSAKLAEQGADMVSKCTIAPSGGSIFNLRGISIGTFTFGLIQSDVQHDGHHGTKPKEMSPFDGLRAVMSLHAEALQIVVAADSDIRSFGDLKGKRVNVGNPGSGTRRVMDAVMTAHGMTTDDFAEATGLTLGELGTALCSGRVDAFVAVTTLPSDAIAPTIDDCDAQLLALDTEVEQALMANAPHFEMLTIPAGTYSSTGEDLRTLGVVATLVTSDRVGEEVVYDLVRALMENLGTLRAVHPGLTDLDPRIMISRGLTAPLHEGAIRYYKERGWM